MPQPISAANKFGVTINGQPNNFTTSYVHIGPSGPYLLQYVSFYTPIDTEHEVTLGVSVRVPYFSDSGTFPITSPVMDSKANGSYSIRRKGTGEMGGYWSDPYQSTNGKVIIDSANENNQSMKGSFQFEVDVDGVTMKIKGHFNVSESFPQP